MVCQLTETDQQGKDGDSNGKSVRVGKEASRHFIAGLEQRDLAQIRAVAKGDLHNHSWLGGRIAYIEKRTGVKIARSPLVHDADRSFGWVSSELMPLIREVEGRETAIEAAFVQAADDGVTVLAMSFGVFMLDRIYGDRQHGRCHDFRSGCF